MTTDGSGNTPFTATLSVPAPLGSFVTATAAGAAGNTSEFSGCAPVSADFYTVAPCRVLDTRDPDGPYGGPALSAGNVRSIVLASRCGVPATARAVSVNLTVAAASAGGHLTLYPGGVAAPFVSTLNYRPGQTRANNAIVALSGSGDAVVRCTQPSGSVQVILDVNGYFE